ncbi:hypothetical protein ACS0TY_001641 [Phlomoides rotata]
MVKGGISVLFGALFDFDGISEKCGNTETIQRIIRRLKFQNLTYALTNNPEKFDLIAAKRVWVQFVQPHLGRALYTSSSTLKEHRCLDQFSAIEGDVLARVLVHDFCLMFLAVLMARLCRRKAEILLVVEEIVFEIIFMLTVIINHRRNRGRSSRSNVSGLRRYKMSDRIPKQIEHMNALVELSDDDCFNNLRMKHDTFNRFCYLLRHSGGLVDGITFIRIEFKGVPGLLRYLSVGEQVALFLSVLSHHTKVRVVKFRFTRSAQTVHKHFHAVLQAVLSLHDTLLVTPTPVDEDCTHPRWKYFTASRLLILRSQSSLPEAGSSSMSDEDTRRSFAQRTAVLRGGGSGGDGVASGGDVKGERVSDSGSSSRELDDLRARTGFTGWRRASSETRDGCVLGVVAVFVGITACSIVVGSLMSLHTLIPLHKVLSIHYSKCEKLTLKRSYS